MRKTLAFCMALVLLSANAAAMDWPIRLGFQLGFKISVVPARDDLSRHLGLAVAAEKILSDKKHSIVVTGYITNHSGVQRDNVQMNFAVTSYVGTGASFGVAEVEPTSIPPGGTARFTAHVSLNSPKPQFAMYTVTAGG